MLYEYPLGAGLGRWGMAAGYFGTAGAPGLWAEIQITGWMIDGGVIMIVVYGGAIVMSRRRAVPARAAHGPSADRGLRRGHLRRESRASRRW